MNENETKLIGMIRESDDPGKAIMTAATIISAHLKRLGPSGGQAPADRQELAGTS